MPPNNELSLNEDSILTAVRQLNLCGAVLSVDGSFCGGQCHVYKLSYLQQVDSQDWKSMAVRVPIYMADCDGIVCALRTEWKTLNTLKEKGFAWSPEPLGCSLTFDNPIKHPFLVLSWGEGSQADWNNTYPARPIRDKFLNQLATIQTQLVECSLASGNATWKEFFERIIRNKRARILSGMLPGLSEQDCDEQQARLCQALSINSQADYTSRSFAIDHGDLKPENIIVDEDYNIKCIIDWAFADNVPLPRAAVLPRFLWGKSLSHTAQQDKQSYLASIRVQHYSQATFQQFQLEGDIEFRTLFLESLFSKNVHMMLARNRWQISEKDKEI